MTISLDSRCTGAPQEGGRRQTCRRRNERPPSLYSPAAATFPSEGSAGFPRRDTAGCFASGSRGGTYSDGRSGAGPAQSSHRRSSAWPTRHIGSPTANALVQRPQRSRGISTRTQRLMTSPLPRYVPVELRVSGASVQDATFGICRTFSHTDTGLIPQVVVQFDTRWLIREILILPLSCRLFGLPKCVPLHQY